MRVQQIAASGRQDDLGIERDNIIHGFEIAMECENCDLSASYAKSLSYIWKGGLGWQNYKQWIPLYLSKICTEKHEKIKYLFDLAMIDELQGNYIEAKKLLEEIFILLASEIDLFEKDHNIFEVVLRIANLAKKLDNFDGLKPIILKALENAEIKNDLKQQVDLLLELALIPEIKKSYQESINYIDRGLNLALVIGYRIGIIDLHVAKTSVCIFHGHSAEAMAANKKALDLAMAVNDKDRIEIIEKQQLTLKEFPSRKVFISYNCADRQLAQKIAGDLQEKGLLVWWDEWEIKVGDSIIQKISSGISTSAHLIVLLSPDSVSSAWVQREVNSAMMKQLSNEKGITVLPALLADCEIPVLLRDIRWADFRKSYKTGLGELLEALK